MYIFKATLNHLKTCNKEGFREEGGEETGGLSAMPSLASLLCSVTPQPVLPSLNTCCLIDSAPSPQILLVLWMTRTVFNVTASKFPLTFNSM